MFGSTLRTTSARSVAIQRSHVAQNCARNISQSTPRADAASSAKNAAEGAAKQLSSAAAKASAAVGPVAARIQGATGINLSSFGESIAYNARVAGSLFKQVYIAEALAPPTSTSAIKQGAETLYKRALDASYWSGVIRTGEWKKLAVYGIEVVGFFTIGEMIGRRHIVGYKLDKHSSADAHH
ncbi:Mitochondrial F1F0-ATP synthase, subunit g/ATP20 [Ceraceosorus bombacis]|uniref:Mitochondrial F1F0-ATP synthase, subunit g/ATP20 n=1 Tax=Ceraceosorus bombacis TaxID=401625 RepID=A0A0P1BE40_9BASI|nr:Mitochondrial F1F0-ATP synthase, subunit g/ATP20 [Ceraceosorus bombacis]